MKSYDSKLQMGQDTFEKHLEAKARPLQGFPVVIGGKTHLLMSMLSLKVKCITIVMFLDLRKGYLLIMKSLVIKKIITFVFFVINTQL